MTRRSSSPAARETEPIADSVDRLAEEMRVLRDAIDEFRGEVEWLTRNGLPSQPIEHSVVKRMAKDPCAADWAERLEIQRCILPPSEPKLDPSAVQEIIERLEASFEAIASGQLELLLPALDEVRQWIKEARDDNSLSAEPGAANGAHQQRLL